MKKFMIMFTAVCLSTAVIAADGAKKVKEPKAPKEKPVLEEVTIVGILSKDEVKKGEKVFSKYVLNAGEGKKIVLPQPQKPKKGAAAAVVIDFEQYVNAAVTVKGMGMKTPKGIVIKTLTSIEKTEGAGVVGAPADQGEAQGGGVAQ